MKKIFYISNIRIPTEKAHGVQIMKMCEAFQDEDYKIELIVPFRLNKEKKDPFTYYNVKRSFNIKKLPSLDLLPLEKIFGKTAFYIQVLSFGVFVWLYIKLKAKKNDIIFLRDNILLSFVGKKENLIFEAHTFPKNVNIRDVKNWKKCKKIIAITGYLKNFFLAAGISKDKILVAPDGVDLKKFNINKNKKECRETLGLPLNTKIVLYAGHLYRWKGVDTLIESSKELRPDISIFLVGGTEADIRNYKNKTMDYRNVKIVGHCPYGEIPFWLKASDVLILPNSGKENISRFYTSPMKLFEYMASCRPIIASNLPSIREILNDNNAILVESDNPHILASAINKCCEDIRKYNKLAERAFYDALDYTWKKRVERIIDFI